MVKIKERNLYTIYYIIIFYTLKRKMQNFREQRYIVDYSIHYNQHQRILLFIM